MIKKLSITLLVILSFLSFKSIVKAQISSSGIAISSPVKDDQAQDGDIICTYQEGNKRCSDEYDTGIFGVISDNPAAAIDDSALENKRLVITSGVATVRVSTTGGAIKEGDFITSSKIAGVGQKSARNGYVVGAALESYESGNPDNIGRIQVMVSIHPEGRLTGSRGNLLQFIRQGISVPVFSPVESLRYLLAVIIVIISFALGMIYFGRASRAGIEAVGRNPLAKNVIQFTVIMNIVLTIVIVLVGLAIAYLILIL